MARLLTGLGVAAALALSACTGSSAPSATTSTPSTTAPATSTTATSTTATTTPAPPTSTPPVRRRTVSVLGSGDVLIHPQLWQQAHRDALAEGRRGYDFGPMLASIAPDVRSASLATCEMESPLAPPQGPFSGWPQFSSPPQVLSALKSVGYDSCTTASNHTIDQGYAGVRRTLDELDDAGLRHTGSARSASEARRPLIMTMPNGVRVAQLAYAFGFNGLARPAGEPWLANLTNVAEIIDAARRARQAGADIVVVSMHWGVEYNLGTTAEQRAQARVLLRSGAIDLILGDHPHVVEPAERIAGRWVIYSMGNQLSRHADPVLVSREGAMPVFTFTEESPGRFRVTSARVIPTLVQLTPKLRLVDLPRALADPTTSPADRRAYRASETDVRRVVDADGAARDGLVVG